MASCMKNIAEGLGVRLNEVFRINTDSDYYRITEDRLEVDASDYSSAVIHYWKPASDQMLLLLVLGRLEIIKLRWKPEYGEDYFIPDISSYSNISIAQWYDTDSNEMHYRRGIVYKTREEAVRAAEKMLAALRQAYDIQDTRRD